MADEFTRESLWAYRQDRMPPADAARFERRLIEDAEFRQRFETFCEEETSDDGSVGAVWRQYHLTCLDRSKLMQYHRGILDDGEMKYIRVHLEIVGCTMCQANLDDLIVQEGAEGQARRQKLTRDVVRKQAK